MENVTQLYNVAFAALSDIRAKGHTLQQQRSRQQAQASAGCAQIRAKYQAKRLEADAAIKTAETFYYLASEQTGAAMPARDNGKQPDFTYMQRLYMQAEDADPKDPHARQLLELSAGAIGYLEKQKQCLDLSEAAELGSVNAALPDQRQTEQTLRRLYGDFLSSAPVKRLADAIKTQTDPYYVKKQEVYDAAVPSATAELLKLGAVQRPFCLPAEYEGKLRSLFGTYYDPKTKTLRLPFGFRTDRAVKLLLTCPDAMKDRAQNALCGLLFNILRHYEPVSRRVLYIDPITYNPEHLGVMKAFVGAQSFISFPPSDEEALRALDRLLSTNSGSATQRESRFLIVRGYPDHLSAPVRDKIHNICNNYEFYRISVILTRSQDAKYVPTVRDDTALSKAVRISADADRFSLRQGKESAFFSWFTAPRQLTAEMVQRFTDAYTPKLLGCEYPKRVALDTLPQWIKGTRQIRVPFGVDAQDTLCSIDFSNTNFAMYLMGAAGSGKSTLLHTIITGLIRNYHPDDVELWLADFKMSEFSQYADPMPPHIKYILMDESPELIYDFVDILTQKMMERKQYFSLHPNIKKLENVPADTYMPAIVVIIDEFSLMSQAVAESVTYKEKLQNLLTEGRALGFKFIFASQEYTNGIQGLTSAAKDQVQMRIAMKNSVSEIRDTLGISGSSAPEHINEWIKGLPPYTALCKTFDSSLHQSVIHRAQVLYFPGKAEKAYAPQRELIRQLSARMQPVPPERYSAGDLHTYVQKHPVIADGNSCKVFTRKLYDQAVRTFERTQTEMLLPGDVPVAFGDPRRLLSAAIQPVVSESRENILLLSGEETACSMSVILSAMEAFRIQGGNVQVWAYRRNRIYISYRDSHFIRFQALETAEQIGAAIQNLKRKIQSKTQGKELTVLLGMDHMREDLELLAQDSGSGRTGSGWDHLAAVTPQEKADVAKVRQFEADLSEEFERIQDQGLRDGKTREQIAEECRQVFIKYRRTQGASLPEKTPAVSAPKPQFSPAAKADYLKDLEYIVTQGSKYGYHFLLCARDYPELRNTLPKLTLFGHRLAFQISAEDSAYLFSNSRASKLPPHICQYSSDHTGYSFRPFLHPGVSWDNWVIGADGKALRKHT